MARSISKGLAPVLEELELNRPLLVSLKMLEEICRDNGIKTEPRVVAMRLKKLGWLVDTPQRGVWEFVPAEIAGSYTSADPLIPVKALKLSHPGTELALCRQSAAWALGLADRVPSVMEVVFEKQPTMKTPPEITAGTYTPNIPVRRSRGVHVLAPESIIVQMSDRPSSVRSWTSALEWLPDVAYEVDRAVLLNELEGRPKPVVSRTGYLLQGLRPDIAKAILGVFPPTAVSHFGRAKESARYDATWMMADSLLPFNPKDLKEVK